MPERHCSDQTCVHWAAAGLSEQGNTQPWPPGLGQVPDTRPSGRVCLLAGVPLGFSSASHHDPPATTRCLGKIWCKRRGEGGFYQSQRHGEEKHSFCLNGAKVAWALHQQGLEPYGGLQTGLTPATSMRPTLLAGYSTKTLYEAWGITVLLF